MVTLKIRREKTWITPRNSVMVSSLKCLKMVPECSGDLPEQLWKTRLRGEIRGFSRGIFMPEEVVPMFPVLQALPFPIDGWTTALENSWSVAKHIFRFVLQTFGVIVAGIVVVFCSTLFVADDFCVKARIIRTTNPFVNIVFKKAGGGAVRSINHFDRTISFQEAAVRTFTSLSWV